jgi:peptide chain release factor 1
MECYDTSGASTAALRPPAMGWGGGAAAVAMSQWTGPVRQLPGLRRLLGRAACARERCRALHPRRKFCAAPAATSRTLIRSLSGDDVLRLHRRVSPLARDAEARHSALVATAAHSALTADCAAELRALEPIAQRVRAVADVRDEIAGVRAMAAEEGAGSELAELAREEEGVLGGRLQAAASELVAALLDRECPEDGGLGAAVGGGGGGARQSVIMEIRAGAGGDEAALFVTDLLNMYDKFAARKRWRTRVLSLSETALGGCREVILRVEGDSVHARLRLEAGVHRVQRVPQTETSGRVHTSAATIAVLRDDTASRAAVKLNDQDVRMDVYRASGAGGQHVNKTESAVRLTHVPTGLVAQSQEDRSQHRNRAMAMEALVARVAAREAAAAAAAETAERHAQLGTSQGERSDRIRTYNFPQRRVTDHRVVPDAGVLDVAPSAGDGALEKNAALDAVLEGTAELDRLMDAVARQAHLQRLKLLVRAAEVAAAAAAAGGGPQRTPGGGARKGRAGRQAAA